MSLPIIRLCRPPCGPPVMQLPGPGAPRIYGPTSVSGTVGEPFSFQIQATGNPTSFGAAPLPPGLSVNTTTGLISGTPTTVGSWNVTVSATN